MEELVKAEVEKRSNPSQKSASQTSTLGEPNLKRSRLEHFKDSDSEEDDDNSDVVARKEIERYMKYKLPETLSGTGTQDNVYSPKTNFWFSGKDKTEAEDIDILKFWCGAAQFPHLQNVAQRLLGIPASQSTDERVFSSTGSTTTAKRTTLSGGTLSQLTFLHKNY